MTRMKQKKSRGGGRTAIARARRRAGLSQTEAAIRMGVSPQRWADIERGRKPPLVTTLRRAARALGVSLADLL